MFFNEVKAKMIATTKNGTNIPKIQFQDNLAKIKLVTVGPIEGASIINIAQTPIAAPKRLGGKICIATVNISGKTMPVPIP